ncbi:hypothetical protein [Tsukamurella pulmonis]|uniref:hypothetical protein n=1 Tax=Tsukamurella pulmonis TaxID=47312 RepID=UPI000E08E551|nr:hypothetical protein [Tsukamurella pulmonis]RDH11474.1 hypothetical protein DVB88_12650 [Tsukamurella pulmonis]
MTRDTTPVNRGEFDTPPTRAELAALEALGDVSVALFAARQQAQRAGRRTPLIHALLAELGHPVRDLPADPDPAALEADEGLRVARRTTSAARSRARRAAEGAGL